MGLLTKGKYYIKSHDDGVKEPRYDAELQLNGRLSITELAEKVGLSISPCHRRVKA
ncbi:AsnC family protein, partial [Acinetobacter baumannii]|uniref:AsnC family protein n=1 Tax=Acinetobacter baumannii TaxID=470 RepID=UPI003981F878